MKQNHSLHFVEGVPIIKKWDLNGDFLILRQIDLAFLNLMNPSIRKEFHIQFCKYLPKIIGYDGEAIRICSTFLSSSLC